MMKAIMIVLGLLASIMLNRIHPELSIVSFANEMIANPPGIPVLISAEDDFFLHSGAAVPGNAHILSTCAFLGTLHELKIIPSAKAIWEEIQRERPGVNTSSGLNPF